MSLAGCGVCPICKHLWELYPDGKLPVHSGDDLMGCAGSRQQPARAMAERWKRDRLGGERADVLERKLERAVDGLCVRPLPEGKR